MLKIEIQSDRTDEKSGAVRNGPRAGEAYHIRQQEGWLHNGRAYPERVVLNLGDKPAWPVGFYELHPSSIVVGEYGRPEFARVLELVKLADAKPAVRAAS
jgi:hypothetical protein